MLCPVVFSKCAMSMPKIKLGSFKMCYVHGQNVQNVLCPYLRYRNSGSFKTCYVQKHGTEIIEVEVWPHTIPCSIIKYVKGTNGLWRVGTNVQYTSRNTHLLVF